MYLKKLLLTGSVLLAGISQATTMPMPISGGSATSVALCKDNKVYAWGENANKLDSTSTNILGLDTTVAEYVYKSYYATPMLVDSKGIKFTQVEAGSGSTFLGISDKGVLYSWGMAYDSTSKYKYKEITPVECGQLKGYNEDGTFGGKYIGNVKKVAGSTNGFIALLNDSTVVISEFFNDVDTARNEQGARINNVVDICAGDNSFFALTANGILYSTGSWNGHGSNQDYTNELKPVLLEKTMEPLKDVVAIGSGDCSSFAVTKDGKAYGWGNGGWGSCTGTGVHKMAYYANPIIAGDYAKISGLDYISNVKQIDGGRGYGAAVTFDGHVLYWGNNEGNGGVAGADTLAREISKPIFLTYEDGSIVNDAVAIECGDNFGFVVNNKNQYFAFGLNDLGQCGVGSDSTTIRYLHRMTFDCELATLCPSIRLLEDTVITCGNRETTIEAHTSSVLDEKDYTLNWYFNEDILNETSNICVADSEGVYKVVMTPKDSLCSISSDFTYIRHDKAVIVNLDGETLLSDSNDVNESYLTFKFIATEETNIILYSDEECTNAIDTLTVNIGETTIQIPYSSASIDGNKASIWLKEITQTTLLPNSEFKNGSNGTFQNHGMMLKTANKSTLKSFNTKFKSFIGTTDISITPALYRYLPNAGLPTGNMELVATGREQKFTIDEDGTVCTVNCEFEIPNNGIYVVGMTTKGTATLIVESIKDNNSALFKNPIHDANGLGIDWVGSTANSYSSPNPAIDNCYFDLVFTDIDVSKCGAVELSSNLEIDKTDCINTPSVNDNAKGDKYDIFGRKIINVQPQTIYIKDGKKYILSK